MTTKVTGTETTLPLTAIAETGNVRTDLGDVAELAASIEAVGLINPVTVRLNGDGKAELVAGHRRVAAAKKLGLKAIAVTWRDPAGPEPDNTAKLAAQLVENLQRLDLDPFDEARGLAQLVELTGSQASAGRLVGRSKGHVSKRLALLTLAPAVVELVEAGTMTITDAHDLSQVKDHRAQEKVAKVFASGVHPTTAKGHIDDAIREQKRIADSIRLAGEAEGLKVNRGLTVVPATEVRGSWSSLEGYGGLSVDRDAHAKEPCHVVAVGFFHAWDKESRSVEYCTNPKRHQPDGESKVKVDKDDPAAKAAKERARMERDHQKREEAEAKRRAVIANLAGGFTDRNAALRAVSIFVLGTADTADDLVQALTAAGVEVPAEPETADRWEPAWTVWERQLEALIAELSAAQLYRAAVFVTIAATAGGAWNGNDAWVVPLHEAVGYVPEPRK